MPAGVSPDAAQARMRAEIRRVHDKMGRAARRKGLLAGAGAPERDPGLFDAPRDLVSDLWSHRGFADVLDWVAKSTVSARLRAEIDTCGPRNPNPMN